MADGGVRCGCAVQWRASFFVSVFLEPAIGLISARSEARSVCSRTDTLSLRLHGHWSGSNRVGPASTPRETFRSQVQPIEMNLDTPTSVL